MNPHAIDLEARFGEPHNALWADSEDRHQEAGAIAQIVGIVLGLRWGRFIFTWPWGGSWLDAKRAPSKVYCFPLILPWLSIAIGSYGVYLGAKDFGWLPTYAVNGIWPDGKFGDRALTLSTSIRRTRIT